MWVYPAWRSSSCPVSHRSWRTWAAHPSQISYHSDRQPWSARKWNNRDRGKGTTQSSITSRNHHPQMCFIILQLILHSLECLLYILHLLVHQVYVLRTISGVWNVSYISGQIGKFIMVHVVSCLINGSKQSMQAWREPENSSWRDERYHIRRRFVQEYDLKPGRFYYWKDQLLNSAPDISENNGRKTDEDRIGVVRNTSLVFRKRLRSLSICSKMWYL